MQERPRNPPTTNFQISLGFYLWVGTADFLVDDAPALLWSFLTDGAGSFIFYPSAEWDDPSTFAFPFTKSAAFFSFSVNLPCAKAKRHRIIRF